MSFAMSAQQCYERRADGRPVTGGNDRQEPVDVVADDREQAASVIGYLRAHKTIRLLIRRLDLGDYLVGNRVLVERKTVADFSMSIIDGRLFRQACRLVEAPYHPLVLIEGFVSGEPAQGVSRQAIQGAMVTLALLMGIPCLRTRDEAETADLIRYAGEQDMRRIRKAIHRPGYRPKGRRKRQLFVLQGLPGVGPARAERLLDTFGSVQAVCSADIESLAAVEGIGRKTAETMRDLIGPDKGPIRPFSDETPPTDYAY